MLAWVMTPCILVSSFNIVEESAASVFITEVASILKVLAGCYSETLRTAYQAARCRTQ
jgi:predicted MarR family transcription regulator